MFDRLWEPLRDEWWHRDGRNGQPRTNFFRGLEAAHRAAGLRCTRRANSETLLERAVKSCHDQVWPDDRLQRDKDVLVEVAAHCAATLGLDASTDEAMATWKERQAQAFEGCMDETLKRELEF